MRASSQPTRMVLNHNLRSNTAKILQNLVFQEVGAEAPTFTSAYPRALAPEASGLESPFQTVPYVGAEAPTS